MKHSLMATAVVCGLAGIFAVNTLLAQQNSDRAEAPYYLSRTLAKSKANETAGQQHSLLRQLGLRTQRQFKLNSRVVVLELGDEARARTANALPPQVRANELRDRSAALQATGLFKYVEPDYIRILNAEPDAAMIPES